MVEVGSSTPGEDRHDARFRLSPDVRPDAYRLSLEPDLVAQTFAGTVEIDLVVGGPTSELVLNAVDLEVLGADILTNDGERRSAEAVLRPDEERVVLRCGTAVSGPLTVSLTFTGVLNDQLVGFYRSTFTDDSGAEHAIATTQLCVTDARRAFPCFDEPAFKSTFEVTVVVPPGASAFSNASVARDVALEGGRRAVTFHPTIRMSTYLVALSVGPFEQTEAIDVDGIALSVVSTPGKSNLTAFALEVGAFALRFYEDYFAIKYPGDKIDLVAIPDFAYGAMENFGCITFRETALLIDEASASVAELQRVALVVAHELAHMWFGDLVTMQWWEGLWLNEAFATQLMFNCVDAFRPSWHLWLHFHEERDRGLEVDSLHSTRPIEFPVHSPAEAAAMIDVITYQKGAAVLRMLEQYLGADVYRDGIRRYLALHAYGNTVTVDLWAALEEASGEPVRSLMDTWILQGGHPVLHVDRGVATQSPFSFGPAQGPSNIGTTWKIPVRAMSLADGAESSTMLSDEPVDLGVGETCVANTGWGFYRTHYDARGFAALRSSFGSLSELQRGVLLSDTWALARSGTVAVADVLKLARALAPVPEPSAWRTVESVLSTLDRIVGDELRERYEVVVRNLVGPLFDQIGWEASDREEGPTGLVRSIAVRVLGTLARDASVRERAAARFDSGELDGDLADAIVSVVASMARPGDRDEMLARMRRAATPQIAERYRNGVAAYADEVLGVATMRSCFELFRLHEVPLVVPRLVSNPVAGRAVWNALTEDWAAVVARTQPAMQYALALGVASFIDDASFADEVTAFHRSHPLEGGQQRVEQSLEMMRNGVAFAARARPTLASAFG